VIHHGFEPFCVGCFHLIQGPLEILWAKFLLQSLLQFLLDGQVWLVGAGNVGEPTKVGYVDVKDNLHVPISQLGKGFVV
jgi:hypothetical protein